MGIPNRAPQLRAVAIFDLVLAVCSMVARGYSRARLAGIWKIEDWLMLGAMIMFLANITTCLLGLHYGTGRHMTDLEPSDIEKAMLNWWLCYPTYSLVMMLSKCSIGIFLNRITPHKVHHWILYSAMTLTAIAGIAFFFITIFQCSPVDYWWRQIYPNVHGHCITIHVVMNITYAYSAIAILTDFTFALLPIHIVMGLQMDRRTKMSLIPIFAVATIASIACAIRLGYIPKFLQGDFLWNTSDIVIWSETEQGLAITAGNLATLRPLFSLTLDKINSITGRQTRYATGSNGSDAPQKPMGSVLSPHSSRRNLFRKRSFSREIEVHTDVDVHREDNNMASAVGGAQAPIPTTKHNQPWNKGAWLDSSFASRGGDGDDFYPPKEKSSAFYNPV